MRTFLVALAVTVLATAALGQPVERTTLSADDYYDKVHGAWLGECVGNMFGLPHEMKYNDEPGPEVRFKPDYCDGARSDDDTDIEYVYLHALEEHGIDLTYAEVAEEWKSHINRRVWVANKRARELMDEGVLPPESAFHHAMSDGEKEYIILRQRPLVAPLDPKVEGDERWVPLSGR